MSQDSELQDLSRRVAHDTENLTLRASYYQALIRAQRASEESLELASAHGDPAARLLRPKTTRSSRIKSSADMRQMARLPVKELDFSKSSNRDFSLQPLRDLELCSLNLSQSRVDLSELDVLRKMPLEELNINECYDLENIDFRVLAELPLKRLNALIKSESLFARLPETNWSCLKNLKLEELAASNLEAIKDEEFRFIENMPLSHLTLENLSRLSDRGWSVLENFQLSTLNMLSCNLSKRAVQFFNKATLKSLSVQYSRSFGEKKLAELASSNLQVLSLTRVPALTNVGLNHLKSMPLRELSIALPNGELGEGLRSILHCPLEKLSLEHLEKIDDSDLKLLNNLELATLKLSSIHTLTGEFFRFLPAKLKTLSLIYCNGLDGSSFDQLAIYQIRNLTLTGAILGDERVLKTIATLPLEELYLGSCELLSDDCFKHFRKIKSLRKLELWSLNVTDTALSDLSGVPLSELKITSCHQITNEGLNRLSHIDSVETIYCKKVRD